MSKQASDEESRPFIGEDNNNLEIEEGESTERPTPLQLAEISRSMDEAATIGSATTMRRPSTSFEKSPFSKNVSKNIFSVPLPVKSSNKVEDSSAAKIGSTESTKHSEKEDIIPSTKSKRRRRRNMNVPDTLTTEHSKNETFLDELETEKAESRSIAALDLDIINERRASVVEKTDKFYKRGEISPKTASSKTTNQTFGKPAKSLKTIGELRRVINFQSEEKRFLIVGLDHDCEMFSNVEDLWNYIQKSFDLRSLRNKPVSQFETMWIDIQNASLEDLKYIEKYFHLHPLTTEDCSVDENAEKWELFEHYLFVVYNAVVDKPLPTKPPETTKTKKKQKKKIVAPEEEEEESETTQLNIIVFDNYVISIHKKPVKGLDLLLKRIETEFEIDTTPNVSSKSRYRKRGTNQSITTIPESNFYAYKYDPVRSLYKHSFMYQKSTADLLELEVSEERDRPELGSIPISNIRRLPTPRNEPSSVAIAIQELLRKKKISIPSSGWILYAFLDAIIDVVIPEVDTLVDEVEDLDDLILSLSKTIGDTYTIDVRIDKMRSALFQKARGVTKDYLLRQVGEAKQAVTFLKRVLIQKNKLTTYLITRKIRFLQTNVQLYMRDVVDHINSSLEKLDYTRELLVQAHSNYTTRVSMDIATLAQRTNMFVNRISIIALTITPVNLIASIWGMNVLVPGRDAENYGWFFGIVGFMILVILFLLLLFRKQLVQMKKEQI